MSTLNRGDVEAWLAKEFGGDNLFVGSIEGTEDWLAPWRDKLEEGGKYFVAAWFEFYTPSYVFKNREADAIADEWFLTEIGRRLGFPVEKVVGWDGNGHNSMIVRRK